MATSISLALASKINHLMNDELNYKKFISFVPPSIQYLFKYSELNFFNNDPETEVDANTLELNRSNFADIVNQIPLDNNIFSSSGNSMLWSIFGNIIENNSVTARVELSDEDKNNLVYATKFCEENYATYRTYKNALDQCLLDYNEAKCSLDLATGDEKMRLIGEWESFREKTLQQNVKTAENDLMILGKKDEITEALNTITNLGAKKGIGNYKQEIKIKLDALFSKGVPGRAGYEYYYTDFSPLGSFEENSPAWNQLTLYSTEIDALCLTASPILQNLFESETRVNNIESISFEYAVISIVRDWFSETFLCSNTWKFALENSKLVSDGNSPANGQIPAYINKVICIRKLLYKLKVSSVKPAVFTLGIIAKTPVQNFNIKNIGGNRSSLIKMKTEGLSKKQTVAPSIVKGKPFMRFEPTQNPVHLNQKNDALINWRVKNIAKFRKPNTIVTIPAVASSKSHEVSFEGIKFIGFECKRLPLSPNPDPNLVWN